ncbi:hypothetical protein ACI789_20060 [Geodermatophilus sp. SYSU D00965]
MPWWVWSLLGWIPLTAVVAAYWWVPRWPEVKRELAREFAARAGRPGRVGPLSCLTHRRAGSRDGSDGRSSSRPVP